MWDLKSLDDSISTISEGSTLTSSDAPERPDDMAGFMGYRTDRQTTGAFAAQNLVFNIDRIGSINYNHYEHGPIGQGGSKPCGPGNGGPCGTCPYPPPSGCVPSSTPGARCPSCGGCTRGNRLPQPAPMPSSTPSIWSIPSCPPAPRGGFTSPSTQVSDPRCDAARDALDQAWPENQSPGRWRPDAVRATIEPSLREVSSLGSSVSDVIPAAKEMPWPSEMLPGARKRKAVSFDSDENSPPPFTLPEVPMKKLICGEKECVPSAPPKKVKISQGGCGRASLVAPPSSSPEFDGMGAACPWRPPPSKTKSSKVATTKKDWGLPPTTRAAARNSPCNTTKANKSRAPPPAAPRPKALSKVVPEVSEIASTSMSMLSDLSEDQSLESSSPELKHQMSFGGGNKSPGFQGSPR